MQNTEIQGIMKKFIQDTFLDRTPNKTLNNEQSLFENGVIDSTGVLEMVAFIEKKFVFRVEDEELVPNNLDSINKLTSYIKLKLADKVSEGSVAN